MQFLTALLAIVLLSQTVCHGQAGTARELLNQFRSDVEFEQKEHNGVVRMDDDTRESYYLLMAHTPARELAKFTYDSNPFVRSYIFMGMRQKKTSMKIMRHLAAIHKNDTAKFISKGGCLVIEWSVNEFIKTLLQHTAFDTASAFDYQQALETLRGRKEPWIKVNDVRHGIVNKTDLLAMDSLEFRRGTFRINSFAVIISDSLFKSKSNMVTTEMKAAIEAAGPGTIVYFYDITVSAADNRPRTFAPVSLKIK